ncbi:MAG TPA: ABC transporter permease [Bryobacteraceae bacterium]|jgi:predicted permease|nr:ABC transporter permease [Bryobacteraceae bacterium]
MGSILQDARFGARIFSKTPALTSSIILLLALGIGANSAMFSVVDSMMLHPVRYQDPEKLVFIWTYDPQGTMTNVSPADFMDLRAQSKSLADPAAWMPTSFVVLGGDRPRQLGGARVTANFFRTLGVKPLLGRTFLPDEDGLDNPANAAHSVVVSYRLWQQDLGADPNVLGRTLRVDSVPYTIVGVMPNDFRFWWRPHDLWIPVSLNVHERDFHNLVVVARLTRGRTDAASEVTVIARALAEAYPKSDRGLTMQVEDLKERLLNRTFRMRLLLLSGAVGLVLLLACTNIASLLLARAAARQKEIAVRISLGATARHLVQQLLTESALLAVSGGLLGLAIAWALIRAAPKFVPATAIPGDPIGFSMPVVWFSLALSLVTVILVGLAPAVGIARSQQQTSLKQSGRGNTAGRASQRTRQIIVGAEVAAALVLLTGAGLMVSSLRNLTRVSLGFDPSDVLTVRIFLPSSKYNAAQALRFYRASLDRIHGLPGVQSASLGTSLPLLSNMETLFDREDSARPTTEWPGAFYAAVDAEYFQVLRTPLIRGRFFTPSDNENALPVAIVTEALAAHFFPNEDPIGRRILVNGPVRGRDAAQTVKLQIVGVVDNVKVSDLAASPKPMIYVPLPQNPFSRGVWFAARTSGNPAVLASAVRNAFLSIDKEEPVEQVGSLEQMLANQLAQPRFETGLMASFALVALILAVLGIYGVNAYAVTQRRSEFGLRMALGATSGALLRDVILRGMLPTGLGIVAGTVGAAATTSLLKSVLVGTDSLNPIAFLGAAAVLAAAAALACYFPARRATRIDPAIILRME